MDEAHVLARENDALRERIATLCAAMLRITATLDLRTVLQEVVDSARALSHAGSGVIATIDARGRPDNLVVSGITPEERGRMIAWADGPRLFEHFNNLPGPLRVDDLPAHVRSLGFSTDLMTSRTLQAVPLRHRGLSVGSFFLAEKEGAPSFTDEDEEVLVLFAAQAAAVVANARTHRDERRARADLEALIETSPVGVVVFDIETGRPVTFNREAARMVQGLATPGQPLESLLDRITCTRADGRETAFDEFPIAQSLSSGETVRAEEIVLSAPDGRSISALVNATPIRSDDGTVVSYVATMQDLAPLEELERQRAEFLSLVGHELRAPLSAIKGSATTVLDPGAHLDPVEMREFFRVVDQQADHMRTLIADLLDAGRIEAGTLSVAPEPIAVASLVDRARRTFLNAGSRHTVRIELPPDVPPVLADTNRVIQVLNNLLANAARHAPASSSIAIGAEARGDMVAISVTDRGDGLSPDRLAQLFRKQAGGPDGPPGGLGLAICKGLVEAHGGRIRAESDGFGTGTRITFTLPVAGTAAREGGAAAGRSAPRRRRPERILVVDDDPRTLRFVRNALTAAGYAPVVTANPAEIPDLVRTERPRLVLLDLLFPDADGIELMTSLPELAELPVIFVSAYGRDETIARALEAGAADYIVKPFSATELVARVRATLRRQGGLDSFQLRDLVIRYEERRALLAGAPLALTATEYELLRVLSLMAGRVASYDELRRRVWAGRDNANNSVRTFVRKLRGKLGDDPADPVYIQNERGVGYRMPMPDGTRPAVEGLAETWDAGEGADEHAAPPTG
ncbi:MAG: response regulator [Gammaproteobacteria bacterium]|nr:response regulator [Gammaproteobacteria bacterium]